MTTETDREELVERLHKHASNLPENEFRRTLQAAADYVEANPPGGSAVFCDNCNYAGCECQTGPWPAERDAARYRQLREQSGFDISVEEADDDGAMVFVGGYSPEELDEAVDKSMESDKSVSKAWDRFKKAIDAQNKEPTNEQ